MDYPCGKFNWWLQFQPFWFYRAERQVITPTDADDRLLTRIQSVWVITLKIASVDDIWAGDFFATEQLQSSHQESSANWLLID